MIVKPLILLTIFMLATGISVNFASAQTQKTDPAFEECKRVLKKSADKSGTAFVPEACASISYPLALWQCVDKQLDLFDFSYALNSCERKLGFR